MLTKSQYNRILHNCRETILTASFEAGACHIGSALSCVGIIIDICYNRMKPNDRFIFSKASGVAALYSVLSERKIINKDKVADYLKQYPLASSDVPGVIFSTGSLGHGLPVSCGLALSDRRYDVYCLMGDSELQEGTTWESLLFASHHKLFNLKIYVDYNRFQACGRTEDIIYLDHAIRQLKHLFPMNIVYTFKGEGVDFMMNNNEWHYKNLTKELLDKALCQI